MPPPEVEDPEAPRRGDRLDALPEHCRLRVRTRGLTRGNQRVARRRSFSKRRLWLRSPRPPVRRFASLLPSLRKRSRTGRRSTAVAMSSSVTPISSSCAGSTLRHPQEPRCTGQRSGLTRRSASDDRTMIRSIRTASRRRTLGPPNIARSKAIKARSSSSVSRAPQSCAARSRRDGRRSRAGTKPFATFDATQTR